MVELLPSAFVGHFRNYIVLFKTHQWSHHQTYALVCPRKLSVVVAELEALIFVCGVESSSLTMPAQSLNHSCLGFTLLGPSWGQGEWISCDLHLWHPAPLSSFREQRGSCSPSSRTGTLWPMRCLSLFTILCHFLLHCCPDCLSLQRCHLAQGLLE